MLPPQFSLIEKLFDELFEFSHALGADYSGSWADASTFSVILLDVTGAGPPRVLALEP